MIESKTAPRHPLATPSLTIERLPMLKAAFEQLGRDLSNCLRDLTGMQCGVAVEHMGVEAMTDIAPALGENGCAALLAAQGWEQPIMAHCSRVLALSCLDLVFGGDGSSGAEAAYRPVTKTERRFASTLLNKVGEATRASLATLIEAKMNITIVDEDEDIQRLTGRGQAAAVVQFRIEHRESLGHIVVTIPQIVLFGIRHALSREPATASQSADPAWRKKLETELQGTKVRLSAVLREKGFFLGDVAEFAVGKVIQLESPIKGRVLLQSADEPMFNCDLGQADGCYSVKIDSSVSHQETAIEEIASEFSDLEMAEPPSVDREW